MKDQVFNLRRDGKIECRVSGIPYPKVQFQKDWRVVADSHRLKVGYCHFLLISIPLLEMFNNQIATRQ